MEADEKKCPFCGEIIKAKAKKCRHCGRWIGGLVLDDDDKREIYIAILKIAKELRRQNKVMSRADLAYELRDLGVDNDSSIVGHYVSQASCFFSDKENDSIKQAFKTNDEGDFLTNDYVVMSVAESWDCETLKSILDSDLSSIVDKIHQVDDFIQESFSYKRGGTHLATAHIINEIISGDTESVKNHAIDLCINEIISGGIESVKKHATELWSRYEQMLEQYDYAVDSVRAIIVDFIALRTIILDDYKRNALLLIDIFGDRVKTVAPELFDFDKIEYLNTCQMKQHIESQYYNLMSNCQTAIAAINESFQKNVDDTLTAVKRKSKVGLLVAGANWIFHNMKKDAQEKKLKTECQLMQNSISADVQIVTTDLKRLGVIHNVMNDIYIPKAMAYMNYANDLLGEDIETLRSEMYDSKEVCELAVYRDDIVARCRQLEEEIIDHEQSIQSFQQIKKETQQLLDAKKREYDDAVNRKPKFWAKNRETAEWIEWSQPIVDSYRDLHVEMMLASTDIVSHAKSLAACNDELAYLRSELARVSCEVGQKLCVSDEKKKKMAKYLNGIVGLLHWAKDILESKLDSQYLQTTKIIPFSGEVKLPAIVSERLNMMQNELGLCELATEVIKKSKNMAPIANVLSQYMENSKSIVEATMQLEIARQKGILADKEYDSQLKGLREKFDSDLIKVEDKAAFIRSVFASIQDTTDKDMIHKLLMMLTDYKMSSEDFEQFINGNGSLEI